MISRLMLYIFGAIVCFKMAGHYSSDPNLAAPTLPFLLYVEGVLFILLIPSTIYVVYVAWRTMTRSQQGD